MMKKVRGWRIEDRGSITKRLIFIFLLTSILYPPSSIFAAGRTSAKFLSFGAGPAYLAMGETGVSYASDVYAGYWNPAGLSGIQAPQAAFMHHEHVQDISQQYAGLGVRGLGGGWGFSLARFAVQPFTGYDASGGRAGSVDAASWAFGGSYGHLLGHSGLSLGGGAKYLRETLGPVSAASLALDLGMQYRGRSSLLPGFSKMVFGASLSNLGQGFRFDHERFPLETIARLGAAYQQKWRGHPVMLAVESQTSNDNNARLALGGEFFLSHLFALRAGFRSGQDIGSSLRLGFGLRIREARLDYSWSGFGALGVSHRIGIQLQLGSLAKNRSSAVSAMEITPLPISVIASPPLRTKQSQEASERYDKKEETPHPFDGVYSEQRSRRDEGRPVLSPQAGRGRKEWRDYFREVIEQAVSFAWTSVYWLQPQAKWISLRVALGIGPA